MTQNPTRPLLLLIVFLVLAAGLGAAAPQLDRDQPIDIELKRADLRETLASFGKIAGAEARIDPDVQGAVTIKLEKTPWRDILHQVCVDHDLRCELLAGEPKVLRVSRIAPDQVAADGRYLPGCFDAIDMSLKGADLKLILHSFGGISDWPFRIDDEVQGSVTIQVRGAPWPLLVEEVCHLDGCATAWSEDGVAVSPAVPKTFDLELHDADPRSALEDLVTRATAVRPIFGHDDLGVEISGRSREAVDLILDDVTWVEAVEAFCEQQDCRWTVRYGDPPVLEVKYVDPRLETRVSLAGVEKTASEESASRTLRQIATRLAAGAGLETSFGPLLDPDQRLVVELRDVTLEQALGKICDLAACHWEIAGDELRITARGGTFSHLPNHAIEPDRILARFVPPGASQPIEGVARFTWARAAFTLGAGGWWAKLTWIPLAADRHTVVPAIVRCSDDDGEATVSWLDAVILPVHDGWSRQDGGVALEIVSVEGTADRQASLRTPPCLTAGKPIDAIISRPGAGRSLGPSGASADAPAGGRPDAPIRSRVGTYLLVAPPAAGGHEREVATAVVAIGAHPDGRQVLALVTPVDGGVDVEPITVEAGEPFEVEIRAADGQPFTLRLEVSGS